MRTAIHNIPSGESGKSNLLQKLVAGVALKRATTVHNAAGAVTREEFNALTAIVASLVQDVEDATSPEKLAEVFNAALKPLANAPALNSQTGGGSRSPLALKVDRGFLAPPGDDDAVVANQAKTVNRGGFEGVRLPNGTLALKAED